MKKFDDAVPTATAPNSTAPNSGRDGLGNEPTIEDPKVSTPHGGPHGPHLHIRVDTWIKTPEKRLRVAWREHAQSRIIGLAADLDCLPEMSEPGKRRRDEAKRRLMVANKAVERRPALGAAWSGVDVERAWVNVHAVEVTLLRLSDPAVVSAKLPGIIAEATQVLSPDDDQLKSLRTLAEKNPLVSTDQESIAQSVNTVYAASANKHVRARSFRNILFGATIVLTLFAIGFGILGSRWPTEVSLCAPKTPSPATCPTGQLKPSGGDLFLVELLGLFSASLVGAVAIRRMQGTSSPYAVPMASLLVKLPTGALTAVGGLLLIRAGMLGPAIAVADTPQLIAYALIFGASQQTFTRLIDRQAQNVLNSIPSSGHNPAKSKTGQQQAP
jgi:hypothetical protein